MSFDLRKNKSKKLVFVVGAVLLLFIINLQLTKEKMPFGHFKPPHYNKNWALQPTQVYDVRCFTTLEGCPAPTHYGGSAELDDDKKENDFNLEKVSDVYSEIERGEQTINNSYELRISNDEKVQSSLRFLKSDQSKPSLTRVSTSKANMPVVINVSNETGVGEWIIPNNLRMTNTITAEINPHPIISSIKLIILFIYPPSNLLTIKPMTTPAITPNSALNSSVNLKPKFSNKITTITTNTPDKTDLVSFDNMNKDYLDNYLNISVLEKIRNLFDIVPFVRAGGLNNPTISINNKTYYLLTAEELEQYEPSEYNIIGVINKTDLDNVISGGMDDIISEGLVFRLSSSLEDKGVLNSRPRGIWSGNSNNGTARGDAHQVDAGYLGKGFEFDGDGDWIDITNDASDMIVNTSGTFTAWFKSAQNHYGYIIAHRDDVTGVNSRIFLLVRSATQDFYCGFGNSYTAMASDNNAGSDGAWHHGAIMWNSTGAACYLDGSWIDSYTYNLQPTDGFIDIGTYKDGTEGDFNGTIDDVMIFNRSLSAAEIQALYANTSSRYLEKNFTSLADGSHTFKAYAQDYAGNLNETVLRTVTVDQSAPTVSIIYPTNGSNISSNSIDVNGSATDNIASSLTYYWVINGTTNTTTVDSNSTFNASDGYYNLTLFVSDGVQNGSSFILFTLDTTAPSWSGNETNATLMKINGNATFNITVTDNGIGLSFYIFSWNGTGSWDNATNGTISGSSQKLIINKSTNLSYGNTIGYRWYANDSVNNWNNSLLRTFTVANTAPTHTTPIINSTPNNDNATTRNLTCYNQSTSDADSDNVKNIYNWYSGNEGITALNMPFENNGSDAGTTDYSGYGNNGLGEGGIAWNSTGGFDGKGAYKFDGKDDSINISHSNRLDLNGSATIEAWVYPARFLDTRTILSKLNGSDGYRFEVGATGNPSLFIEVEGSFDQVISDGAIPLNEWTHLAATFVAGQSINLYVNGEFNKSLATSYSDLSNPSDLLIGRVIIWDNYFNGTIDEVRIYNRSLSGEQIKALYENKTNLIISNETNKGENWICGITPNDGTEDGSALNSTALGIANSAPTTPDVTYPEDGKNYSDTELDINYSSTDVDGDTITYDIYINNTLNITTTTNVTDWNASDGYYNLTVTARDSSDSSANSTVVNFRLDSVKPSFSNNKTNASSTTYNGTDAQINLTITDNGAGIDFYRLATNDTSDGIWINESIIDASGSSVTAIFNYSIHNFTTSGGTLGWRVWANDTAGNVNLSDIYTLVVQASLDTTKPKSNITSNNTSPKINQAVNISMNVSDETGLSHCWFYNNMSDTNSSLITLSGTSEHSLCYNISTISVSQGKNVLFRGYVNDTSNNLNWSDIIITVANTAPTTPDVTYPEDGKNYSDIPYINYSSTDADGDSISYTIYINGTLNITTTVNVTDWNASDGYYNLTVTANDSSDVSANSTVVNFRLDTTAPNITLILPADATSSTTSAYNFTFNVSDAIDVSNCSLVFDGSIINTMTSVSKTAENGMYNSSLSVASYTWSINCTDALGNVGNSSTRSLTVTAAAAPEEPAAPAAEAGAGAGGGAGAGIDIGLPREIIEKELKLSQDLFDVDAVLKGSRTETLTITNEGNVKLTVSLDVKGIEEYLFLSDSSFELEPSESKTITLNFIGKDAGTQTGMIIISADGMEQSIPVMIDVELEKVLFDVKMDIPAKNRKIRRGEELQTQVTLLSMGEPKKVDVAITYIIKDLKNKIISKEYETIAVEKELSFVKSFPSKDLEEGEYVAAVEADYADSIAISGSLFKIEEIEMLSPARRYGLLGILSLVLIISIIFIIVLMKQIFVEKERKKTKK